METTYVYKVLNSDSNIEFGLSTLDKDLNMDHILTVNLKLG